MGIHSYMPREWCLAAYVLKIPYVVRAAFEEFPWIMGSRWICFSRYLSLHLIMSSFFMSFCQFLWEMKDRHFQSYSRSCRKKEQSGVFTSRCNYTLMLF